MTSTTDQLMAEVTALSKRLRMPYLRKAAAHVLPTAKAQRWDLIRVLLTEEAQGRDAATIRNRRKRAPVPLRQDLRRLARDRLDHAARDPAGAADAGMDPPRGEPAVVGPSGTGKSHLLEALGNAAIDDGLTVSWFTIETLGALVTRHRADDSVDKAIKRVLKTDLVVVDDIGLLPVPVETAEALFRVIDAAYERRSVAISSNVHPAGFDQLLPATLATAAVGGSCTTPTSWSPRATATGSPRPATARG